MNVIASCQKMATIPANIYRETRNGITTAFEAEFQGLLSDTSFGRRLSGAWGFRDPGVFLRILWKGTDGKEVKTRQLRGGNE